MSKFYTAKTIITVVPSDYAVLFYGGDIVSIWDGSQDTIENLSPVCQYVLEHTGDTMPVYDVIRDGIEDDWYPTSGNYCLLYEEDVDKVYSDLYQMCKQWCANEA